MASAETTMSYGSTLSYATTSGGSYTTLGGMKNIENEISQPSTDVSALEDTTIVRLPKRTDLGTISGDCLFRRTIYSFLFTALLAKTKYYWKITDADGSVTGPFYGNINRLKKTIPDDEVIMCNIAIETSGVAGSSPTFTPGS